MTQKTKRILLKMLDYSIKIMTYTDKYTMEMFMQDTKTIDAVVFNLSQIGELVALVDNDTKSKYQDIDWISIKGLRNRIVHDYEGIKTIMIWHLISKDIPELLENLHSMVNSD